MVTPDAIIAHADAIAARFKVERIVLFGSYAYGAPTADSDVDLLVVRRYIGPSHRAATAIRMATEVDFPQDILVYSPRELRDRLAGGCVVFREIVRKGIVLYDAVDHRVGQQGRRRLRRRHRAPSVA